MANEAPSDRMRITLQSLPPEILFMILSFSFEPNLIHTCRQLRSILPPFVEWTKSLTALAICLRQRETPFYVWSKEYVRVLREYESICGIGPLTLARRRELRAAVFKGAWFTEVHFRAMLLELHEVLCEAEPAMEETPFKALTSITIQNGHIGRRQQRMQLYTFDQLTVAVRAPRRKKMESVTLWWADDERIVPTKIINMPLSRVGSREHQDEAKALASLWLLRFIVSEPTDRQTLQDALVASILEKDMFNLTLILEKAKSHHPSDPLSCVEWKHIDLAARQGNPEIFKVLLYRDTFPAWEELEVKQLAEEVKNNKNEGSVVIHRLLMSELRMLARYNIVCKPL